MISATTAMYLDDLRIVKSIHDGRGISGAVRLLKINHSTISRRLAAMEASLDTQLFERRRSGYLPTQAGLELIQLAERVEKDVTGVLHRLSILARGHRGMLRVTTSDALAHSLLTPIIADFRKLNPEMTIDVTIGNRSLSLVRGECDVAIRTTLCPADNLFGRKVSTMHWALYGKPSPRKNFQYPSQMQEENWVSFNDTLSELKAFSFVEQHIPAENVVYRTNSIAAAASAIAQGMGIGLLPCVLADSVEGISRIGPIENDIFDEIWILTHPELRKAKPIRAFMKYCADAISARDNAPHTHAHDGRTIWAS